MPKCDFNKVTLGDSFGNLLSCQMYIFNCPHRKKRCTRAAFFREQMYTSGSRFIKKIGVLIKRCSEHMQPIYRKVSMQKYDFNKVALQLC